MKRIATLLAPLAALCLCASAAHAQTVGVNHAIQAAWIPPSGAVQCSSTVTTSCLEGYTENLVPPAGQTVSVYVNLQTTPECDPSASPAVTQNCMASGGTGYTWAPGGALFCGSWTVSLVANYLDAGGNAATSAAIQASVTEPCPFAPVSPSGLGVSVAQ
jgi:hypothetical protein